MQAMILAAGFGTRLLPYTLSRPKPLFPIMNTPLLLLTIRRLQRAGCDHIVVNCHHLRHQIAHVLQGMKGVVLQEETTILGTGGGLRLALDHFRDEPVLVSNGDIYHTIDYQQLYRSHQHNRASVTMAMHDYPRFNTVSVSADQVVGFDQNPHEDILAFTGLHVLDPEMLSQLPVNREYCIIEWYRHWLRQGHHIAAVRVDGCFWTDMGTVEDYLALHGGLLTGVIPLWPEIANVATAPFLVDKRARQGEGVVLRDWVCAGNAIIGNNTCLQQTVVWDGAVIAENETVFNCLVTGKD